MEFHEKLQELRKQKNLTQEELSEILFVSRTAISKWESGVGFPDINTLEPLADALGITLTELMKCSKETDGNLDDGIIASIEIAKIQRKKALKKIIIGCLACIIGICAIIYAIQLFVTHSWSLRLSGNDGATSVFIVGKVGNLPPVIILAVGIIILLYGLFAMLRSNNNDK